MIHVRVVSGTETIAIRPASDLALGGNLLSWGRRLDLEAWRRLPFSSIWHIVISNSGIYCPNTSRDGVLET